MPFSMGANVKPPRQQAIETVHAALASGVELIDTADIYAPSWNEMGHNELIVAEALRSYADDKSGVVVATKGGITRERERAGAGMAQPTTSVARSSDRWVTSASIRSIFTTGTGRIALSATAKQWRPWPASSRKG